MIVVTRLAAAAALSSYWTFTISIGLFLVTQVTDKSRATVVESGQAGQPADAGLRGDRLRGKSLTCSSQVKSGLCVLRT